MTELAERLLELARGEERAVLFTVVEGPRSGAKLLVLLDRGERVGNAPPELAELVPEIRRNGQHEHAGLKVFAEVYGPPPRLVVVGAVDTAAALCAAAKLIGWHTICVDARARFATAERIPSADELIVAWPDEALDRIAPDHDTAVVVLTHDEKFDVPALTAALATDAFYVGAIGSRKTQARRRERLLEEGLTDADLDRIHGPAGLDLGADSPAETALSILIEALAARAGRPGTPLKTAAGRIHVED
ncbi:MAG: XdhC family protein [Gaiellaceae bacterium]